MMFRDDDRILESLTESSITSILDSIKNDEHLASPQVSLNITHYDGNDIYFDLTVNGKLREFKTHLLSVVTGKRETPLIYELTSERNSFKTSYRSRPYMKGKRKQVASNE